MCSLDELEKIIVGIYFMLLRGVAMVTMATDFKDMVQLLFICRNSDPKKFTFFTTRPVLLCKNETDKYFSMNSSGFY